MDTQSGYENHASHFTKLLPASPSRTDESIIRGFMYKSMTCAKQGDTVPKVGAIVLSYKPVSGREVYDYSQVGSGSNTTDSGNSFVSALENALQQANGQIREGILILTSLEPHPRQSEGQFTSALDAIVDSGIQRVVVGYCDLQSEAVGYLQERNVQVEEFPEVRQTILDLLHR